MILSIVTPVYNCAKYIEESILSVINQKIDGVEYLIVDGASTDGTNQIIKKYSNEIDYWVSEEDKGQAHALNKGIKKAKGKFIFWLNGDDQLYKGVLDRILPSLKSAGTKSAIIGNIVFLENGQLHRRYITALDNLTFYYLLNVNPSIPTNATIYPKELFEKTGYCCEHYHYSFDYELYLRLVKNYRLEYIDFPFILFRIHKEAKSSKDRIKFDWERLKIRRKYGGKIISKSTFYSLHRVGSYLRNKITLKNYE